MYAIYIIDNKFHSDVCDKSCIVFVVHSTYNLLYSTMPHALRIDILCAYV